MRLNSLLAIVASLAWLSVARIPTGLNPRGTSLNPRLSTVPLAPRDLPVGTCDSSTPCENGACCGKDNLCGYSAASCGTGCQFNCDAKSECGPYGTPGSQKCPLNVCCSEFGFCGSTTEFCVWTNPADPIYPKCDTQWGGCGAPNRPTCSGNSVGSRSVGYYESWSNTRQCQKVAPEDLNIDQFSHINFAFAFFDPTTFQITPMDANGASLYSRFTDLKSKKPGLETWISVGGWSFTDPPNAGLFSTMAGSSDNRAAFIQGLISFMSTYGFDGVDIDWEYPGADDRGGSAGDTANFVTLAAEMKSAFAGRWGLTITLPTSYWYLQHFDLAGLQPSVSWFNVMSYDLHGVWDAASKFLGPYIAPHTNITEIDLALDLLWRTGVSPDKVVLGQGWYGRSFTLSDPSCNTPNGVCQFSGGANAGPCSNAAGILDLQEIENIIAQNSLTPVHDQTAAVKWITWGGNQWVSYDDVDTFKQKRDFANSRCLGGMMVWAMDQVDQTKSNSYGNGNGVSADQQSSASQASADMAAGISCYTTDCGAGCKSGTSATTQMNGQPGQLSTSDRCSTGQYRTLCCDSGTTLGTCQWRGYRGVAMPCLSGCADGETELVKDTNNHNAKTGDQTCTGGLQSYCCAGFSSSPSSSLLSEAGDVLKDAAEAAAEQLALDIAAKAFCRVAVPALLAPLELLEDLIPFVGEILDIAEIAATPAIIDGCVKGIEKEGKAEFKVFGKEHTLSMDKPTVKPDKDTPPAKTADPAKTNDEPAQCTRKPDLKRVKKRTTNMVTEYVDTDAFKVLARTAPILNDAWRTGMGWALKNAKGASLIPDHYLLIVGFTIITRRLENSLGCDGQPNSQKMIVTRDYQARPWDILNGPQNQCMLTPRTNLVWWNVANSHFSNMGPINPALTAADVERIANEQATAMGQYSYWTNNCGTYTGNLYQALQ